MTSKQRAELRAQANTEEPILHVGKGGITENVIMQAEQALTARELFKGCVLEASPIDAREAATQISAATLADVVQVIGNRFVLYRLNPDKHTKAAKVTKK